MPQAARIRIILIAQASGAVRLAPHPDRLRRADANRCPGVVSDQLNPARGSRGFVEIERFVPMNVRLAQLTEVEIRKHAAAVPEDSHVDLPANAPLVKQPS